MRSWRNGIRAWFPDRGFKRDTLLEKLDELKIAVSQMDLMADMGIEADRPSPSVGFRDAVREILRDVGKGMRPRDVTLELKKRNFPYTAKTDMNVRVSNELHRMVNSNQIRKRGKLYYSLISS